MPATQPQASFMQETSRRGLKPGQKHSGSFKKGDDPRRAHGMVLVDGKTFGDMARKLGPAVVEWWDTVWRDDKYNIAARLRASELIVERGFGKAVSTLDINVNDTRQLNTLTMEELEAIANGEQPQYQVEFDGDDNVIDAVFTTAPTTSD